MRVPLDPRERAFFPARSESHPLRVPSASPSVQTPTSCAGILRSRDPYCTLEGPGPHEGSSPSGLGQEPKATWSRQGGVPQEQREGQELKAPATSCAPHYPSQPAPGMAPPAAPRPSRAQQQTARPLDSTQTRYSISTSPGPACKRLMFAGDERVPHLDPICSQTRSHF